MAHALSIDADQQISAVLKNTPQNDRWREAQITPRRGDPFTLIAVADGEGDRTAGDVAGQALGIAFAEATLRRDDPLPRLLKHLANQMNEVVSQHSEEAQVGVTLGAVQGDTVWLIQAGSQTRCYRVRGENSILLLTDANEAVLGRHTALPSLVVESHRLKRGDKLVFCTDGLFAGDLVTPADLGKIDRYQDVKGAARHLSALAMGRNVNDNVTVVVAAYGRRSRLTLRSAILNTLVILAAVLIVATAAMLIGNYARILPRPPDLGIAVLARGRAEQVELFRVIYPGSDINAEEDSAIHLNLKRRESLQSSLTASIPGVDLHLGPGSYANLTSLDVEGFIDTQYGILQPVNLTEMSLYSGRLLVLNRDERVYYVWAGQAALAGTPLLILEGAESALGMLREDGRVEAYCLRGTCSLHSGGVAISLPAPSKVALPEGAVLSQDTAPEPMQPGDWAAWQSLCTALQSDPEVISGGCMLTLP